MSRTTRFDITEIEKVTSKQRWSNFLVIFVGVFSLFVVFNIRSAVQNARSVYINDRVGLRASYPANWLLSEDQFGYVFRVQNLQEIGYKTSYTVSIQPVSGTTTLRTIFDISSMQRAQTLAAYRVLSITDYDALSGDIPAQMLTYTYVETDNNPFLEVLPVVVTGVDIVTISRGQAIIITLLSESTAFEQNFTRFQDFVRQLEY